MADTSEPPAEGEAAELEKRVDKMMVRQPAPDNDAAPAAGPAAPDLPALDIFSDQPAPPGLTQEEAKDPVPADGSDAAADSPTAAEAAKGTEQAAVPPDDTTEGASDTVAPKSSGKTALKKSGVHKPALLRRWWFWAVLAAVALAALFAVPLTRYQLLGLVVSRNFTVVITDATTHTPVSRAEVVLGGQSVLSDANGRATLQAPVGKRELSVAKHYYKSAQEAVLVPFRQAHGPYQVSLTATGRQVPIRVINKLTGKGVADATVGVLDTAVRTDKDGNATIVLPASAKTDPATIRLSGFNDLEATVQVTAAVVPENTFALVPVGTIYFLSNQSGKIYVVKTDLDGSNRQAALSGTGNEDASTQLLQSRDWRYLMLLAKRDSPSQQALYLIDTATGRATKVDGSNGYFNPVGWQDHSFIYDEIYTNVAQSQPAREQLKSYNADTAKVAVLDQTQVDPGSGGAYAFQSFSNFHLMGGTVVYTASWDDSSYNNANAPLLANKSNVLRGIQPDGQNKQDYKAFPAQANGYMNTVAPGPDSLLLAVYSYAGNNYSYYDFDGDSVQTDAAASQAAFDKTYPTYLQSPDGHRTFWSELRDGKHSLFFGNAAAQDPAPFLAGNDYEAYGWYGSDYVLLSKDGSELYIAPADSATKQAPLKLSNYYSPDQAVTPYGRG